MKYYKYESWNHGGRNKASPGCIDSIMSRDVEATTLVNGR